MEIEVALNGLQVDHTKGAHISGRIDFVFFHHFAGALNDAADAGLTDEHVMRFFGEHESASTCEGIEAGFGQGAELEFAVAVSEESEHVKSQPIGRGLVESAQNARIIGVTRAAGEQKLCFFAAITAEKTV